MAPSVSPLQPSTSAPSNGLDLEPHGLQSTGRVFAHLDPAVLVEMAIVRGEGFLTDRGALVAYTGDRTGRSPNDRFVVESPGLPEPIWWGPVNHPIKPSFAARLHQRMLTYLQGRDLFIGDGWACADPRHRLPVRVITEKAWHTLFAQLLLLRPPRAAFPSFEPEWTILHACDFHADPASDGTKSGVFIILDFEKRQILVGGTHYAGEIKKAVFSVLNYLLPQRGVFPMHCSANIGAAGDTALFFGLSGTGKTTLSADPERRLIGDDEHGWSDDGVFNIEGGCYAKTIRLSAAGEPQIWNAIRFGCVLENVVVDPDTRRPDFDSEHYTENTRAAYPVEFIDNCELSGMGGHPKNVIFLACDAFGVLPPLSRLTTEQAMYHFLSGYTAKVAGTETGITTPTATFSTCFAEPFLPLHPTRYATLLQEKLNRHRATVWLINTGWAGGPAGVAKRVPLTATRAMVRAALNGSLKDVACTPDPVFGVLVPSACPGVPAELLQPRKLWRNPAEYDAMAKKLAELFRANFAAYEAEATEAVKQAGPRSA